MCVPRSRSTFLLDYSNGVDALLLTNPAADRFCVLGRPGRYPDQKKNAYKKNFQKGVRHVRLFPTRTESYANIYNIIICYISSITIQRSKLYLFIFSTHELQW